MLAARARTDLELPPLADERWVNVIDPDSAQVDDLQHRLSLPPIFIRHALDIDELARIEKDGTTTLIVLRIPYFQGTAAAIPFITIPLGIILTEHRIITICKQYTDLVQEVRAQCMGDVTTAHPDRVVLRILLHTADRYLSYVREINTVVDLLEGCLHHSLRNQEVLELLKYQKSLTHFTTGLELNEIMLERLQHDPLLQQHPEDADLLADALTEIRQAIAMTSIASNILSQMMDAFASIISNNLNMVMKFLAAFTIVLTFPTLIASFYGMNVALPGQHASFAFLMTVAVSVGVALVAAMILWKKDWL